MTSEKKVEQPQKVEDQKFKHPVDKPTPPPKVGKCPTCGRDHVSK